MERPRSHVTDSLGEVQMRELFVAIGWVVNRIETDYGVDFDVQMFEGNRATGEWFKIQLKSSENTEYSATGDFVSEVLPRNHAAHYSTEIRDPIFLIHADTIAKRTFWFAPQLAAPVAANDPRTTVTYRIETRNELPTSLPNMVSSLRQVQLKLGARAVSESRISDFAETVEDEDAVGLIQNFQNKIDVLRLKQIHALASEGKLEEAKEGAEKIIESKDSSIGSKFSALLEEERMECIGARLAAAPQSATPEIYLRISKRLQRLTKKGPPALKFYALMVRKAAELDALAFRDVGLFMNLICHVRGGDPLIALHLAVEHLNSTHRIIKKYNQCVRLARYASKSRYRWALPNALLRVVEGVVYFILTLKEEGQLDTARVYQASAMQFCRLAVWIAEQNHDDATLSAATTVVMLLADKKDNSAEQEEVIKFARETLSKIEERRELQSATDALDRAIKRMSGKPIECDPKADPLKQIVENRASGLGINMNNPEDLTVKLIQLGIRDASPERVIRHCEHAFASISGKVAGSENMLAELLQLPSIRAKIIHCTLLGHAVERRTLDDAFQDFGSEYCDNCKDISPRALSWRYSDEWQEAENEKHREFMTQFRRNASS
jgi:Domain of unknown function (DUF4365)